MRAKQPPNAKSPLTPFRDGCAYIHVSERTAERRADELPKPIRVGGRRFFFQAELDAYLAKLAAERVAA